MRMILCSLAMKDDRMGTLHFDAVSANGLRSLAARVWPQRPADLTFPQAVALGSVIYHAMPFENLYFSDEHEEDIRLHFRFSSEAEYQESIDLLRRVVPHPDGLVKGIELPYDAATNDGEITDEEMDKIEAFLGTVFEPKNKASMKP